MHIAMVLFMRSLVKSCDFNEATYHFGMITSRERSNELFGDFKSFLNARTGGFFLHSVRYKTKENRPSFTPISMK